MPTGLRYHVGMPLLFVLIYLCLIAAGMAAVMGGTSPGDDEIPQR